MSISSDTLTTPSPGVAPATVPVVVPSAPDPTTFPSQANQPAARAYQVPAYHRSLIWGVPFDHVTLPQSIDAMDAMVMRGTPSYVITANLNYVMLNHRYDSVRSITANADLILADGQPIVWRSRLNEQPLPERVAGSEMIHQLSQRAAEKRWGVYFLGGEPGVAATCAQRLASEYPGMRIAGVESPPFRPLDEQEQAAQDARIRQSGAQILLVAFGQPKGERWIQQNYQRLGVPVSIQLGASFDFIAGTARRAPLVWQRFGMEWAYRMLADPRRLMPRYGANAMFLASALVEDWKQLVTRWGLWSSPTN